MLSSQVTVRFATGVAVSRLSARRDRSPGHAGGTRGQKTSANNVRHCDVSTLVRTVARQQAWTEPLSGLQARSSALRVAPRRNGTAS
jgi:hypothetical protein